MSNTDPNPETRIALFQRKEVRRTIHNNEWWFAIADVVAVLTDSVDPGDYLKKLRKRDPSLAEAFQGGGQLVPPLGLGFDTPGGRQMHQCWNTEGVFRLIQSIPSPKAEPFKRWLAKVGYERIQEIEDPELATKRTRALYKAKGYSDDWIEKRMRSIAVRDELTDEWSAIPFIPSFVRRGEGRSKPGVGDRGTRSRHERTAACEVLYPTVPPLTKGRQGESADRKTLKNGILDPLIF